MSSKRGALIVFEGLDRAGKSTQARLLSEFLSHKGIKVKYLRFPDRATQIGQTIDSYLKGSTDCDDHVIHLLFSANRWEAAAKLGEDLLNGTTLIVDRYSYSGAVYSAAKGLPGFDLDWAWSMEIGLPQPDLFIFLSIKPEVASLRGNYGTERYEDSRMQLAVRNQFARLLPRAEPPAITLDGARSVGDLEAELQFLALQALSVVGARAISRFGPLKSLDH